MIKSFIDKLLFGFRFKRLKIHITNEGSLLIETTPALPRTVIINIDYVYSDFGVINSEGRKVDYELL